MKDGKLTEDQFKRMNVEVDRVAKLMLKVVHDEMTGNEDIPLAVRGSCAFAAAISLWCMAVVEAGDKESGSRRPDILRAMTATAGIRAIATDAMSNITEMMGDGVIKDLEEILGRALFQKGDLH